MRTNSGAGKAKNNNHDPTLKEHEAAKGRSGEAILDAKAPKTKHKRTPEF